MKKYTKYNTKYKKTKKRKTVSKTKYPKFKQKTKKNIKKLNPSNIIKVMIILGFIFILLGLKLSFTEFKKKFKNYYRHYAKYEKEFNRSSTCDSLDPINIFNKRLKNDPIELCKEKNTNHICYINPQGYYNKIFANKGGVLCTMENIVLDPSKLKQTNLVYNGPVVQQHNGFPRLSKGFFNTKCAHNKIKFHYNNYMYGDYFHSWDYNYNIENENEKLEELAPGKTILLISRNDASPNLFHGNSEIINVISMLYLFNLAPEEVQIIIYDGIQLAEDPFYEIYKNMLSRGGELIYARNLKKKYKISKAINVPINWDSPPFIYIDIPKCNLATRTYKLYNDLIDKYMALKPFKDKFISDNITYYYPYITIKNYENEIKFKKKVTIQWRKVWPKKRKGQTRLLSNATLLADKLAKKLPNDILVRLIDTATLSYKDQISLMRNTDYLIGIHGAGLSLCIFLPKTAILHEMCKSKKNNLLTTMSALSGHKTYSDLLPFQSYSKNGNEYIRFNEESFIKRVLDKMNENNFF